VDKRYTPAMKRSALIGLVLAALVSCRDAGSSDASDARAQAPAPGHVLSTFKLEEQPYCESCTGRLHTELDGVPGISAVDARVGDPLLRVWHDEASMPAARILELLQRSGEKASLP
jgi:hypothetical protein